MRYRLRTLLIVLSASALALAAWRPVERGRVRQFAIRNILADGGEIEFDSDQAPDAVLSRCLSLAGQIANADFTHTVRQVRFGRGSHDDDLAALAVLSEAQSVDLSYCFRISDQGVEWVGKCSRLEELWLYRNDPEVPDNFTPPRFDFHTQGRITDKSLKTVAQCPRLRLLLLYDNDFTDDGLTPLHSLTRLERIGLLGTDVSADGAAALNAALPNCKIEWLEASEE